MVLRNGRSLSRRVFVARDDRGATAAEYAIMVSLIALVIIGGVRFFGEAVNGLFELIRTSHPFD